MGLKGCVFLQSPCNEGVKVIRLTLMEKVDNYDILAKDKLTMKRAIGLSAL
jgi:hypothetical protein